MIKNYYEKEIKYPGGIIMDMKGDSVKKVQEWVNLRSYSHDNWNIRIPIDGHYGPKTQRAIIKLQEEYSLMPSGNVGPLEWDYLTENMQAAFTNAPDEVLCDVRDLIIINCYKHFKATAMELGQNEGPWVRAYMDGNEGRPWAWCVGSAMTIIDQSCSYVGKDASEILPLKTYSCDQVGKQAMAKEMILMNKDIRRMSEEDLAKKVKPGDIFLVVKHEKIDWVHTGIIESVKGKKIYTFEGNTNDEGSREGYEFVRRVRDLNNQNIDIVIVPYS